jgi:hypothetical protein
MATLIRISSPIATVGVDVEIETVTGNLCCAKQAVCKVAVASASKATDLMFILLAATELGVMAGHGCGGAAFWPVAFTANAGECGTPSKSI